ncbi:hypothetical protein RhiirC2_789092 [Rhizophagus irregularis]|uniref:Uncharacterized protein n=1 Tax=Rhizophagus irregularis TaxID=588596 RepID=A0A2N1MNV0_9GLOM|nr:hypothetical protein RhiirC2_789092 [Rhizophagus irregularis]
MAKIHSFYISNIKAELVYTSQKYIVDELHEIVNDSIFLQFENVDEIHESETILKPLEIPNHEVQVLIIEKFIDLKKTVRELDNENTVHSIDDNYSNDDSSNENDENDNLEVKTDGYNIEELTNKYLLDNEDMFDCKKTINSSLESPHQDESNGDSSHQDESNGSKIVSLESILAETGSGKLLIGVTAKDGSDAYRF